MVTFFVPPPLGTPPVSSIAFQTSADSASQTITCPTVSQYDIAVLFDAATNTGPASPPANVVPSGFTQIQTSTDSDFSRNTVSYKVMVGTESGSSLTGMNGAVSNAKILLVFRPNGLVLSVGLSSFLQQTSNGDVSSQLIGASGQSTPLVRLASAAVGSNTTPPPFTSGTFDATLTRVGSFSALRVGYTIQNTSPSNDTVDIGDNGNGNCLISGWMNFA